MNHKARRGGKLAAAMTMAAALGVTAACSSGGTAAEGTSSAAPAEKITLTLQTFGGGTNFGYKAAVEKWNAEHPDVQVKYTNLTDSFENVYWPQMLQWLQSGTGAGDVVGIDEGGMGLAKARPQFFTDLGQYGLNSRKADFPAWKWENGLTADGKLFALGTDVGGMSICYRADLFEKAGLPANRDEVSKLWSGGWDDFIKAGQNFQAKVKDAKFVDSVNTIYNVVLSQESAKNGNVTYFDRDQKLIAGTNPAVRTAFDLTQKISQAGLTAKLQNFTDPWNTGFVKSQFATLGCPGWMLGVVSGTAGDAFKGKWDVATVPGGGGNWGGSWLAVPKQSKHPKEAAELAGYLTGPEAQLMAFKEGGNLPSTLAAQDDPALQGATNPYFGDAPIGKIFGPSIKSLQPTFLGERHAQVKREVEQVITGMDQGSVPYAEAWDKFVAAGEKAAR
ncbi:ABC transporter substrate-binding protein [Sphaerisporangium siamense]|uniref:Cellobiose transport system substrate-binding protein n=1 Tax=Sphaerisporangium siamense TaxID=795645 RepID=A0A7W7DCK4_9ACTN|nr:ABC transporter substrate-binding protein [Sphaerisporangium siamense]MBB4704337.1 cellobiose transport system substrate-binding protein [Sphaerisporangium siamense]GII84982.1 ABC transporter substrate-binding protein [Sphaerisporangium siamense]